MIRKSLLTCLSIIILSGQVILAQHDSDTASVPFKSFDHGLNLNFINGYALGYKWNNMSTWNSRLYLTFNIAANTDDSEREIIDYSPFDTTSSSYNRDDWNNYFSVGIEYHLLNNFYSSGNFRSYAGGGVLANYYLYKGSSSGTKSEMNESSEINSTSTSYFLGLIGKLGIEVELNPNVTIYAESSLIAGKYWDNNDYTSDSEIKEINNETWYKYTVEESSDGWRVSFNLIQVGIGIYF